MKNCQSILTILWHYVNLIVRTLKNIYQRFFYVLSAVGKPTSDSRHDLDDMVQSILERWKIEGIMILPQKGSGDIWEVKFLWRSKAWPERNVPWFGDVVDKYESHILCRNGNSGIRFNDECYIFGNELFKVCCKIATVFMDEKVVRSLGVLYPF